MGTPLLVLALVRFPRKPVLLGLIGVFLAGNLLSALSADYSSLLLGRVITAVAHGSLFAIGATVAARLAPKGQASNAIAAMFAGLTLAMVVGVPLGSFLGNGFGWRLPFFAVVGLALLSFIAATIWLSSMSVPESVKPLTQLSAAVHPAIIPMMLVTVLGFGASLPAFTFITPILTDITRFSGPTASLLLIVFGGATVVGNLLGGRIASKFGWRTALRWLLVSLAVVLAILGLVMHLQIPTILVLFV
ncbi:MFS transporter [Pseudomonas sp. BN607]|uniref:MFS transporter n=1 Tax=Pseudomonas sp. BN607 TaxID=2567895 RepID=UPI0032AF490F